MGRTTQCPQCGTRFSGPWFKRFCCSACRCAYHTERRKQGLRLLEQVTGPEHLPETPDTGDTDPSSEGREEVPRGLGAHR